MLDHNKQLIKLREATFNRKRGRNKKFASAELKVLRRLVKQADYLNRKAETYYNGQLNNDRLNNAR